MARGTTKITKNTEARQGAPRCGQLLAKARERRGYTQRDLAEALHFSSHGSLVNLEKHGKASPELLREVITFLHTHVNWEGSEPIPFTRRQVDEILLAYAGLAGLPDLEAEPPRLIVVPGGLAFSSFWTRVMATLALAADRYYRYHLTVIPHGEDPDKECQILTRLAQHTLSQDTLGIIWAPAQGHLEPPAPLQKDACRQAILAGLDCGLRYVVIDRPLDQADEKAFGDRIAVQALDHFDGGAKGVLHLYALGYREVALLADVRFDTMQRQRVAGALAAWSLLQEHDPGLPELHWAFGEARGGAVDALPPAFDPEARKDYHHLRATCTALWRMYSPRAFFATTSFATTAALAALTRDCGRQIPEDIGLLGFDLVPEMLRQDISVYPYDPEEMALGALAHLVRQARDDSTRGRPAPQVSLATMLPVGPASPLRLEYDRIAWGGETMREQNGYDRVQARRIVGACLAQLSLVDRQAAEKRVDQGQPLI